MNQEADYDLDEIGGDPLLDSGFEAEEPEQTKELASVLADSVIGGSAE